MSIYLSLFLKMTTYSHLQVLAVWKVSRQATGNRCSISASDMVSPFPCFCSRFLGLEGMQLNTVDLRFVKYCYYGPRFLILR